MIVVDPFGLACQRRYRRGGDAHGFQFDLLLKRQVFWLIVRVESLLFHPSRQYQQFRIALVLSGYFLDIVVSMLMVKVVQFLVAFVPLITGFGLAAVLAVAGHANGVVTVSSTCRLGRSV